MASKVPGEYVYEGFLQRGFSPVQAAVLTGNFQQESSFDPRAFNPKENAFGAMQWRLDRLTGLQNYAQTTGRAPDDIDAQMDWVVQEMQGPEAKNAAAFLTATDPAQANAALKRYIRYAHGSENARLQNAMSYIAPKQEGGNMLMAQAAPTGGNRFVNPAFPNAQMPDLTGQGAQQPMPAPMPMPAPLNPQAPLQPPVERASAGGGMSDDDLLRMFLPQGQPATVTQASQPGAAPQDTGQPGRPMSDDDLLRMFLPAEGAPQQQAKAGYEPSMVPWLDPINAFVGSAVEAIPIVGKPLSEFGNQVDAAFARMIEGKPITAEDRAAISQAENEQFPLAAGAGQVVGTVAPIMALGATGLGGRLLGTTGNMLTQAGVGGLSSSAIMGADTLVRGGTPEEAGKNALLAGALGAAAPVAMGAIGAGANKLMAGTSEEVARLAQLARDKFKIPVGPGQMSENQLMKFADSVVNKIPFSGGTVSNAQQQTAFNKAVASTFGETSDKITPEVMNRAKSRLGTVFESVAERTPTVMADEAFDSAMLRAVEVAEQSLTEQQLRPIMRQFDNIIGKFQQGNGQVTGKTYQELTKKGTPLDVAINSSDPGVRNVARQFRSALDEALERSAPADVVADLRKARSQWRAMKTVEDLAEKSTTGDVSPALLMGAVRGSYGDMAYGGGGDLADLARIGQQFLKAPPSSGTAERTLIQNLLVGGGTGTGAVGLAMNPHLAPAAIAGGAAALGAGRALGAALRSDALANKLINNSLGVRAPTNVATPTNLLTRAVPPAFMLPEGPGGNRGPLRITVEGASPVRPGQAPGTR